ncbi:MAG: ferrous iron transport protein B [Christensenellaceae bacterium]|jgi:ferrous iron transport protein B|nr:ferrous iron transport protein B [Christensenellaceae bacterium]
MRTKVALAGNPNCGKTTMFNSLTGSTQYVGNWPGVTVEKKEGFLKGDKDVVIQDLPGIYSLSPYTLEEVIARDYLLREQPDAILNILDGANLERNLYLTTQLMELGIPMVIALNMMDVVRKNGDRIDVNKLSAELGFEIVETSALKGEGSEYAAARAVQAAKAGKASPPPPVFGGAVEHALAHIEESLEEYVPAAHVRWYAIKLFERDEKVAAQLTLPAGLPEHIETHIEACETELDDDAESIITNARYAYIARLMTACVQKKPRTGNLTASDRIDRVVTNRILALPIFALVMFLVYYISVTTIGTIVTDFTNDTLVGGWLMEPLRLWLETIGTAPWLTGLVVDGIIGGVGAVLGFVPQMLILFLFLAILEDVGYMARVAFIMDRIFRRFGLSGKSFIPMLIGSGCGVPGIMASRTIENERDRRMTIMTTTFIPCGAKMPIVGLIAGAVFGGVWWVAPSAYFLGIAAILASGIMLKKTRLFAGDASPFVMELPAYHAPSGINVLRSVWERGSSFVRKAGTIILAASVFIWFFSSFAIIEGALHMVEDIDASMLAAAGNAIAPAFAPLGFGNWQSTVATLMGLVAKEEVVSVFGVLYGVAGDAMELVEGGAFGGLAPIALHFTALSAYCFLIFNLLCAPCFAAIGAMHREMASTKWTLFAVGYQCGFAYVIALIVYQLGIWFAGGAFGFGTAVAFALLLTLIYMLLRPAQASPAAKRVIGVASKA